MVITVQQMLTDILRVCKVVASGETPEATELADALRDVNMMLNTWSDRNLMIQGTVRSGFPLTANVPSYTIGPGGAFNTTKPNSIIAAFVRDANGNDSELNIYSPDIYDGYDNKVIAAGRPEDLFYDPGAAQQATPVGTVTVYPMPDSSTTRTLYLDMTMPLVEFVNLTDTITFDKGAYFEAIKYNAAKRIWGGYYKAEIMFPPNEDALAKEAMRILENINSRTPIAHIGILRSGGGYNIYSDE